MQVPPCIKDDLGKASISPAFSEQFANATKTIEQLAIKCKNGCGGMLQSSTLKLIDHDEVVTDNGTGDDSDFLFFPTRLSPNSDRLLTAITSKQRLSPVLNDVGTALYVSQNIGYSLKTLLNTPIFGVGPISSTPGSCGVCTGESHRTYLDPQPIQVYFIDDYGLNRIVGRIENREYYVHQFSSSINFNALPYYVPAVSGSHGLIEATGSIDKFFFVSDPYFDIAGNGLVVTLARGFSYPHLGRGALCFDLGLQRKSSKALLPLDIVDRLGSIARVAHCTIPFSSVKPECVLGTSGFEDRPAFKNNDATVESELEGALEEAIETFRNADSLSEVTGSLSVLRRVPAFDESSGERGVEWVLSTAEKFVLSTLSLADPANPSSSASQGARLFSP